MEGGDGRAEPDLPALQERLAGIGLVDAAQALGESALAGTIVADEGHHLARVGREVGTSQGVDVPEGLDDPSGFEDGLSHLRHLLLPVEGSE